MITHDVAPSPALFPLGQCSITPGALALVGGMPWELLPYLDRHAAGDWGDLNYEDQKANWDALRVTGGRLLSHYIVKPGAGPDDDNARLYIITEADRSRTTIMLPEEY